MMILALLAAASAALAADPEHGRVRLDYDAHEGCRTVAEFRESVAARLHRVPFSDDAPRELEVRIELEEGNVHRAHLALRDASGAVAGERTIRSKEGGCESFGEAIALAASIALDPSFMPPPELDDGFVVLDPVTVGVDEERARILAEFLRAELRDRGASVVERSAMTTTSCDGDPACATEEARRRGVARAVLLAYERIDRKVVTTAIVLDAATGDRVHGERLAVDSLDRLIRPRSLARGLLEERPIRPEPSGIAFGFEAGLGRYRYADDYGRKVWGVAGASSLRVDLGLPNGFQLQARAHAAGVGYERTRRDQEDLPAEDDSEGVAVTAAGVALRYNGPRGAFTGGVLLVDPRTGVILPLPILAARFGPEYGLHGTISLLESRDYVSAPLAAGLGWGFGDRSRAWAGAVAGALGPGVRFEMDWRTGRRFTLSPSVAAGTPWGIAHVDGAGTWLSLGISFGWDIGDSNRRGYQGDLLTGRP